MSSAVDRWWIDQMLPFRYWISRLKKIIWFSLHFKIIKKPPQAKPQSYIFRSIQIVFSLFLCCCLVAFWLCSNCSRLCNCSCPDQSAIHTIFPNQSLSLLIDLIRTMISAKQKRRKFRTKNGLIQCWSDKNHRDVARRLAKMNYYGFFSQFIWFDKFFRRIQFVQRYTATQKNENCDSFSHFRMDRHQNGWRIRNDETT